MLLWQTKEDKEQLLKQLVQHDSVTHSTGEKVFVDMIKNELNKLDYFNNTDHLYFADTDDDRRALIAHYAGQGSKNTIVLISHYDTVGIDDFAEYKNLAFNVDAITENFKVNQAYLDEDAINDVNSGEYLFGRGVMDMKPGLMLHMALIEQAINENWDINLILVTVPDEEVGSKGMLAAVKKLREIKERHDLNIILHLNSEPTFQQEGNDASHYVYTGTIGKIMPAVLVYGLETHVGNSLNGLSSNFVMSYINKHIEYNKDFKETFDEESTPPPVSLLMRDIKEHYDVQTPFRTVSLYNTFLFNRTAEEVFDIFNKNVKIAVKECMNDLNKNLNTGLYSAQQNVPVLTFESLYKQAVEQFGYKEIERVINEAEHSLRDSHMRSIEIVDRLMTLMKHITPAVVTFFTPPYYPAANSSHDEEVLKVVDEVKRISSTFHKESKAVHYFNGISDLSYVKYASNYLSDEVYSFNTPSFNRSYSIPFNDIKKISAPIVNIGPIGKDAHKISERILKQSAFVELPKILEAVIKNCYLEDLHS